jgi:haloalkane dehalogenase
MTNAPDFVPSAGLYPFTSRWLDTSRGRVHHVDEGTGRPLLLLHTATPRGASCTGT